MNRYLKEFQTHADYEAFITTDDYLTPNVSYCEDDGELHYNHYVHDYRRDYLTFEAIESGKFAFVALNNNVIFYSLDDGETWVELPSETYTPALNAGDKILWKGEMTPFVDDNNVENSGIGVFSATAKFNAMGNPMSLLFGDNYFGQYDLTGKPRVFANLFSHQRNIVSCENMPLVATTLSERCYINMFKACSELVNIQPILPATTLTEYCYSSMFINCTKIEKAPVLPAETLAEGSYIGMFGLSDKVNYVKALFIDNTSLNGKLTSWLSGVASNGTFVKNNNATWDRDDALIPSGWTIITESQE